MTTEENLRIYSFEDLEAWKIAIDISVMTYKITASFPKSEIYSLTNQMRRASSSISANIAEGYGRYSTKEKCQFYKIANGSLYELKSFFYLAEKLGFIDGSVLKEIQPILTSSQKLTAALIRSIKDRD
ncbi:four helix bundle protein [Candidatus Saccharibacteria bacterium]|nr:four helix bundle protein [Candidatus Saccharibacteria bacterium]